MSADLAPVVPRIGQFGAARALGRQLRAVNSDFHALANIVETSALSANRASADARSMAVWLIKSGASFSPREKDFLHSMANWRRPLSPAQLDWLAALLERVSSEGRRA
jgi:hypothetical protein